MHQVLEDSSSLFAVYKSLFEYNPDASYAIDRNGKFVLVNETAIKLTGYSREEFMDLNFSSIIKEEYVASTMELFIEVLNGGQISFEVSIYHKSGDIIDLYVTSVPIIIEGVVRGIAGIAQDITDKNDIQTELVNSKEQLQNIFNSIDVFLWSGQPGSDSFLQVSPACEKIYGYTRNEFMRNPSLFVESIHPDDRENFSFIEKDLLNGNNKTYEYRIIDKQGQIKWISSNTIPTFDEAGKLVRVDGVVIDISQRRRAEEELEFMAYHDILTELPNRRQIDRELKQLFLDVEGKNKFGVLYLDLDHFKLINDTLGHTVGNELLKIIAQRLITCLRRTDTVARQGGDEFIILLKGISSNEHVKTVTEKISNLFRNPIRLGNREYIISASMGISLYPEHADEPESLIDKAVQAMYVAKKNGKMNSQLYHLDMSEKLTRRLELEQELHQALIKEEGLSLNYQPIIDTQLGTIAGFEALLRWHHIELGSISPAEFIPIAEDSRLVIPIGEWVFRTACKQFKELQKFGCKSTYLSVNVSSKQFEDNNFVSKIIRILDETNFDPYLLKIEITESIMMQDIKDIISKLCDLKKLGIEILLDDFGTGYSSLSYLQELPIDKMKIDRSFIQGIGKSHNQEVIIRIITSMAKDLGMGTIAEGVEENNQLLFLKELGCTHIQGFLFSKPVPFELIPNLLKKLN